MSRLRRGEVALSELPPQVAEVLSLCARARDASGGWFNPWSMPGGVDPTGLVKGWAVEQAAAVLRGAGVTAAMVNGGGDIAVFGAPEPGRWWRAGIQHPWRAGALACGWRSGRPWPPPAVTSAGRTCSTRSPVRPARLAASATVTGPSLAFADALATALAAGGDAVLPVIGGLDGYAAYLIRPDGSETQTSGLLFVT